MCRPPAAPRRGGIVMPWQSVTANDDRTFSQHREKQLNHIVPRIFNQTLILVEQLGVIAKAPQTFADLLKKSQASIEDISGAPSGYVPFDM